MKKLYFLLLTILITTASFGQDLIISGIYDGPLTGGTPKGIELYVINNIADLSIYGVGSANNGGGTDGEEFTFPADAATAGDYIYVASEDVQFPNFFGFAPNYNAGSAISINGDDAVELFMNGGVIDVFGDINVDGSGTAWDSLDGWAYRVSGTGPDGSTFALASWTFSGINALDGETTNASAATPIPIGTYSTTGSTATTITINSPSDFAVLASGTTSVDINFTTANLNTGDQVDITVTKNGGTPSKTTDVSSPFTISGTADGDTYEVTAEIVNGATQIDFETIDFSIALPCDLILGTTTTTCDASTNGVDTYTTSIDFTGGNTGITYTLATDVGTISGDNPSNTAAGTITITGVNEGTDIVVTAVGGTGSSCDLSRNITGPTCKPLPIEEPFDYTVGVNLVDVSDWENFSGTDNEFDVVSGNLSYPGLAASTGNSIHIEGGFVDSRLLFTPNTGTVYASFIFKVTDLSSITDLVDGGYFAVLGNFDVRLWVHPDTDPVGTTFDLAFTNESSGSGFTTTKYNVGDNILIVMSYEAGTGVLNGWVNPNSTDFGGSAPAVTMTNTDVSPSASIDRFILRQDSAGETPAITFDELRIGTSWAEVTPSGSTASVRENNIPGFNMYPNPVSNGKLTINTFSNADKEIQIFDILGKRIFSTTLKGKELNVSTFNSGIYILKILEEGKTATRKLVIK